MQYDGRSTRELLSQLISVAAAAAVRTLLAVGQNYIEI